MECRGKTSSLNSHNPLTAWKQKQNWGTMPHCTKSETRCGKKNEKKSRNCLMVFLSNHCSILLLWPILLNPNEFQFQFHSYGTEGRLKMNPQVHSKHVMLNKRHLTSKMPNVRFMLYFYQGVCAPELTLTYQALALPSCRLAPHSL